MNLHMSYSYAWFPFKVEELLAVYLYSSLFTQYLVQKQVAILPFR